MAMKKYLFAYVLLFSLILGSSQAVPEIQQDKVDFLKPKLNSDRIEYFFGSYGVETLDIDSPVFPMSRITNLYSIHQGEKIMRTLAVVDFSHPVHPDLMDVHREIREGKSIGIALREQGWTIYKNPVYFGVTLLSPAIMAWMEESYTNQAALHIYRLDVSKKEKPELISYCTIIEVHSPQYLNEKWLRALNEDQYDEFSIKTEEVAELLSRLSVLIQGFPFKK